MGKIVVQALFIRVKGRVQGVGFRYSAMREAQRLGINGYVKNTYSGDVELWAEGQSDKLPAFLKWLNRGPPLSRVDSVETEEKTALGYTKFSLEH